MKTIVMSAAVVMAGCILAIVGPAQADLPPGNKANLGFSVFLDSGVGGFSEVLSADFDEATGKASLTATEQDIVLTQVTPGVTFGLQVDVDADPKITYSLTLDNGTAQDLTLEMNIISVAQPYDENDQGKHSLKVTGVDQNGGGVKISGAIPDFGSPGYFFMQEVRAGAQDLLNPPFARTGTDPITVPLHHGLRDPGLGAGPTTDKAGPSAIPSSAAIGTLTPDGKFNKMTLSLRVSISAGDKATFEGELEIGKNLGGGGGGNGGGDPFPPYAGSVPGKFIANLKKIAKVKDTEYSLHVSVTETDFEFTSANPAVTFGGTAEVLKGGKKILMTFDGPGTDALESLLEQVFTTAAGTPVDVAFVKPPTAKGSVKKDGEKAKFSIKVKITATTAESSSKSTVKINLKGPVTPGP